MNAREDELTCPEGDSPLLSLLAWVRNQRRRQKGRLWFRGQPNADHELKLRPGAFRTCKRNGHEEPWFAEDAECEMAIRFRNRARLLFEHAPDLEDWCGWLSLMQHYRVPTRLLDWTESPLAATWFAVYETLNQTLLDSRGFKVSAALWVLNPSELNRRVIGSDVIPNLELQNLLESEAVRHGHRTRGRRAKPDLAELLSALVHPVFLHNRPARPEVLAVNAPHVDRRMEVQRSMFTIHGDSTPLEEFADAHEFLTELTIPREMRREMSDELYQMGIGPATFFPDPEHLAEDVRLEGLCLPRPQRGPQA
jgi:hypothetical protein